MAASLGHTSAVEGGNIRIQLTFKEVLKEEVTCLLYLEYNNSVLIDSLRTVTRLLRWTQFRYRVP